MSLHETSATRAGHGPCISKDAQRNWKYKGEPCRESGVQVCKAG